MANKKNNINKKIKNIEERLQNIEPDNSFEELARQVHKERVDKEYWENNNLDNRASQEYSMFCCWCRAYKNAEFTEENFKEYQRKEHIKLNFWLKKRIAELFFGYKFTFDYNTNKWSSVKN